MKQYVILSDPEVIKLLEDGEIEVTLQDETKIVLTTEIGYALLLEKLDYDETEIITNRRKGANV